MSIRKSLLIYFSILLFSSFTIEGAARRTKAEKKSIYKINIAYTSRFIECQSPICHSCCTCTCPTVIYAWNTSYDKRLISKEELKKDIIQTASDQNWYCALAGELYLYDNEHNPLPDEIDLSQFYVIRAEHNSTLRYKLKIV